VSFPEDFVLPLAVLVFVGTLGALSSCPVLPIEIEPADYFREPECRWCPGNRGWEWSIDVPTALRTPLAGTVTFAGPGARDRYVTVRLADGRRTTIGPLERIDDSIVVGEAIGRGAVVGVAVDRVLLTVRSGDRYLDPFVLWSGRRPARLVPLDGSGPRRDPPNRCPAPRWGSNAATG
jgi:hypothetical protein